MKMFKSLKLVRHVPDPYFSTFKNQLKNESRNGHDPSVFWPQLVNGIDLLTSTTSVNYGNHPYIFEDKLNCKILSPTDYFSRDPSSGPVFDLSSVSGLLCLKSLNNYGHALWDTIAPMIMAREIFQISTGDGPVECIVSGGNRFISLWVNALGLSEYFNIHSFKSSHVNPRVLVGSGNYFLLQPSYASCILYMTDWYRRKRGVAFPLCPKKRIFLTRGISNTRIKNYVEFVHVLSSCGFEIVQDDQFTTKVLSEVLNDASITVVEPGAGSTNLIFSHPESKIIMLTPNEISNLYSPFHAWRTTFCTYYAYGYRNQMKIQHSANTLPLNDMAYDPMQIPHHYDPSLTLYLIGQM